MITHDPDPPVQELPEQWSDERQHILDESCWCNPVTIKVEGTPRRLRHKKPKQDSD